MADPAITLSTAQTSLSNWIAADTALSTGAQSYSIGGRQLTKVNAQEIRNNIKYWSSMITRLLSSPSGGLRVRKSSPIFD